MMFFNRIRTLSLSALTAALLVAPGCDDGADYEALGVTVEELEEMSAEELDALEGMLGEVDIGRERMTTHEESEQPHERPDFVKEMAVPLVFTHGERPGFARDLKTAPRPTHSGVDVAPVPLAAEPDGAGPCEPHVPGAGLSAR